VRGGTLGKLDPVDPGHYDIGEQHVVFPQLQRGDRFDAILAGRDHVARLAKCLGEKCPER
tara:strand:- start:192 stop:371 length:180 start_codon:yes stop_codon:yes gene_type:complete